MEEDDSPSEVLLKMSRCINYEFSHSIDQLKPRSQIFYSMRNLEEPINVHYSSLE